MGLIVVEAELCTDVELHFLLDGRMFRAMDFWN